MKKSILILFYIFLIQFICIPLYANNDSLKILLQSKKNSEKLIVYLNISKNYLQLNADSALVYAKGAIEYGNSIENEVYLPDFIQIAGYVYFQKGDYTHSANYLLRALIIFEKRKNEIKISDISTYLGMIYQESNNYNKSLQYYLKALHLYNELSDSSSISSLNNNLGLLYFKIGDFNKSFNYLNNSLGYAQRNKNYKSAAFSLNNISLIYKKQKDYNTSLKFLSEARKKLLLINDKTALITILVNLGEIYKLLNKPEDALINYKEALVYSKEISNSKEEASILLNIANTLLLKDKYDESFNCIINAEKIIDSINDLPLCHDLNKAFSSYYEKTGNYNKALMYYNLIKISGDSLSKLSKLKKQIELKIQYETNEAEKENELLRQNEQIQILAIQKQKLMKNTFIAVSFIIALIVLLIYYRFKIKNKANKLLSEKNKLITLQRNRLEEINITKDKFFSIIAHDLKNPFYNIKNYASILEKENGSNQHDLKKEIIGELDTISEDTYALLENLINWASSQKGIIEINKENILLSPFVKESIRPYKSNALEKQIDVKIMIDDDFIVYADRYTLATVLGNLFYNAVKFTQKGGEILFDAKLEESKKIISISDNGVGISPDKMKNLFVIGKSNSTPGTINEKGTGLGLIICKDFVEMNGGSIVVESELGNGSKFNICLNI